MRKYSHINHSIPLLLGLCGTAVILGAAISMLPENTLYRALAVAPVVTLVVVLAASAAPAAFAKSRRLAAGLRWWDWLWVVVFVSGLVFRGRDTDTLRDAPVDFWAAWRMSLMGLVALVLLGRLASRTTDWAAALVRGLPAGIFLCGLTSLISTLWSIYPLWTLYKSVEYLVDIALLAAVLTAVRDAEEFKSLFDVTWFLTGLFLLTVWLGVLVRPDLAVVPGVGLIGIQIHGILPSASSNGVGDLGATLLIIAATRLLLRNRDRSFYWMVCLAALPTLVLAQSRSPATAALLGLLTVLVLARRFGLLVLVGLAGTALIWLKSAGAVVWQAFLRGQSPEMFYSLSGRVGWWTFAWTVFRDSPFLGLGGYAGGRFAVLGPLGADSSSVHNGWLEILLGVGLVGFLPFLATFLGIWPNLLRPLDARSAPPIARELRIEAAAIFVMLCFRSMFTVEFIWHPPLFFLLTLGYAEVLRRGGREGLPAGQLVSAAWRPGRRSRGASVINEPTNAAQSSPDRDVLPQRC